MNPEDAPEPAPTPAAAPDVSSLPVQQNTAPAVQAPPQAAAPAATPEHRSFLSSVLGALSNVFGGPKTHSEANPQGTVDQVQNTTGQRVASGIGSALAVAGSTLSGHNYEADIQKQQQQQEENAQSQAKLTQNEILSKATIAHQNNQMLLAQRNEERLDTAQKSQISDSNRAFELTIADKGFSKPPIMVNGKDINGSAGNEADMMKYFSGPGSHKAPDGYSYLYVPSTDEKGNVTHSVYLAPVDQMKQPLTISKASFKQQTGLDAPGAGDTVTTTLGGLTSLRSQFVESHLKQAEVNQKNAEAEKDAAMAKSVGAASSDDVAQMLANGTLAPSQIADRSGARTRAMVRAQQLNPSFSPVQAESNYKAGQALDKYFTSGEGAKNLTAFNTASDHLSQLNNLVDALGNSDATMVNAAKQSYAKATGSEAPTDFDAVRNAAVGEVTKVFSGAGVAQAERDEISAPLKNSNSPAQLKGAITQMRNLMASKKEALQNQYTQGKEGKPAFDSAHQTPAPTAPEPTATGPKGEKMVFRGGQWVAQ